MKISVVIPTHQRKALVVEAIASVIRQERPADEIIVVDDGSTDGTSELLRREYGSVVRLVGQENRGLSAARNAGVKVSSGDLVAFLDDDDLWFSHHLCTIEAMALRFPEAVLVSTGWGAGGPDRAQDAVCRDLAALMLLGDSAGAGAAVAVAVRREAYDAVGGFDERIWAFEDWDLQLQLSLLGPMAFINGGTFERRDQPDSLWRRAIQAGMHREVWRLALPKLLVRLGESQREDAPQLRRAVAARIARDAAISALAQGAPARVVRSHLVQMRRFAPFPEKSAEWIVAGLAYAIPEWREDERIVATLAEAWPDGDAAMPGYFSR